MQRISSPIRDQPPCMGCTREIKAPGCHGRCEDYKAWKKVLDAVKENRREYAKKPWRLV